MYSILCGIAIICGLALTCRTQIIAYNFTQTLDHFNSSDERTFTQQYQVLPNYYQKGAPIILIVGPERAMLPYEIYVSSVNSYFAPKLHAFIIATEHRYYGQSLPFSQDSFYLESLKYLTINQSLADYAAIVKWVKEESIYADMFLPSVPVIAVGGSYGGYLSALLRIQYPDIFLGSLASCTVPYLWALPNQGNLWFELVSDTFLEQWPNSTCYDSLNEQFSTLVAAVNAGQGVSVQTSLSLCEAPTVSTYWKLSQFIKSGFSSIVEFNYPHAEVFCVERPFETLCSFIQANETGGNQWFGIMNALQLNYNRSGNVQCFEWESFFPTLPTGCKQSSQQISPKHNSRTTQPQYDPWLYQSCTEVIYGAAGGSGIFRQGVEWSLSLTNTSCQILIPGSVLAPYQPIIDPTSPDPPSFTNVIFSSAGFDPNRGWTLTEDASSTVVSVYVATEAHTADISYFPNPTPALEAAMQLELNYMQKWLDASP